MPIVTILHAAIPQACPTCKFPAEPCVDSPDSSVPREGDYLVCPWCGSVSTFDAELNLQKPGAMALLRCQLSSGWETIRKVQQIITARADSRN